MNRTLTIKISDDDLMAIKELAWASRTNVSDLVRLGIRPFIDKGRALLEKNDSPLIEVEVV